MRRALLLLLLPVLAHAAGEFDWIRKVGSGRDVSLGLATDARGNVYVAGTTHSADFPVKGQVQPCLASAPAGDIFVIKLDSSGNVVYSTCVGGSGDDAAYAFAADAEGGVYVAGVTYSPDFPATRDAYRPDPPAASPLGSSGWSFVFKLNAEGTVAFSTFFTTSLNRPSAVAVDGSGSVYLAGTSIGELPVTPGAYQSECNCGARSNGFFSVVFVNGFLAKLDPAGSRLQFATYLGFNAIAGGSMSTPMAVAADGSSYIGAPSGIYHFDASGTALVAKTTSSVGAQAMALASDGSLYAAGGALSGFQPTAGAAQTNPNTFPPLDYQFRVDQQNAVVKLDADLRVTAATYFGGPYSGAIRSLAVDPSGRLVAAGDTAPHGLPTRSPMFQAFGSPGTGFAAVLASDLSTVQFSSYFGDSENFSVQRAAAAGDQSLVLAGMTFDPRVSPASGAVWLNKVRWSGPETLRIDSVANAASHIDDPLSGGETVAVQGEGFTADSRLAIGGAEAQVLAVTPREITAVLPAGVDGSSATIQVRTSSAVSNSVLVPIGAASPGLFSVDRTGRGQGWILNADGSRNGPDQPVRPGERITIFATGVGPVSFDQNYAVTANPVSVYIDGFYCRGVAATMSPVEGLPGDVYQLTVIVPTYEDLIAANPDLKTFRFPAQAGIVLRIAGGASQNGLAISIAP
jgi:uncharacterized protein (TIGR03437 family)